MHKPVLLEEVIEGLNINSAGGFVDATFGRGGHSQAILQCLGPEGTLLALDQDMEAIEFGKQHFKEESRLTLVHSSFENIGEVCKQYGMYGQVNGILLDLGVSSPQLETPGRGFSFMRDGPLDMRMNSTTGISAAEYLANVGERELANVIWQYGEEKASRRIAKAIVTARAQNQITTTLQLAEIIKQVKPRTGKIDPATKTFQALRIVVNDELAVLKSGLSQCVEILKKGGRLVVISFHSLEDRLVKRFLRSQSRGEVVPKMIPAPSSFKAQLQLVGKAIKPSSKELSTNPRARSAVLRIAEKVV